MRNWEQLGTGTAKNWGGGEQGAAGSGKTKRMENSKSSGNRAGGTGAEGVNKLRMTGNRMVSNTLAPAGDWSDWGQRPREWLGSRGPKVQLQRGRGVRRS